MQTQPQAQQQASAEAHQQQAAIAAAQLLTGNEPACRCGWFESSYELRQGLEIVIELTLDETELALWFPAPATLLH
ncbi:hypothetical protein G8A07_00755 [Roseateles sp. DAIF2]|uniref:hypothetical protein n=1 Tax=Roseateles sp. DAIF2 TaxID=2714952 RepID=UPI0018A2E8C3|nr:hypothetical protein [Roseateles sp. DAIF2]QPF71596.1 hypothetical protein G8A07_00755 [Roseateles sp. DAIF2]